MNPELIPQLLLLAAMQGISELFPISSLGHSVLVPALLHWPLNRDATWFLPFIVVLHLGTALALGLYFWRDWWRLLSGFARARGRTTNPDARLLWLLMIGTVPAGLIGLLLEHRIRDLFGSYAIVAVALILNGGLLWLGDRFKHHVATLKLEKLSYARAFGVGIAQSIALIPGFSRSGATLVAGLAAGLDYAASARFSFLLATPIIAAAGVLEIPKLLKMGPALPLEWMFVSGIIAGLCALFSTAFLMRWFGVHEVKALRPFAIYCALFGVLALWIG